MTHTEGPWRVVPERNFNEPRILAGNIPVATVEWKEGEHDANARLIAAAPLLLAALRDILDSVKCSSGCEQAAIEDIGKVARAAIAKAEGRN